MKRNSGLRIWIFAAWIAGATLLQAQTLPDDPAYRSIRQNEASELRAAGSSMEKAELYFLFAQRRFSEARWAIGEDQLSLANELIRAYNDSLQKMLSEISREISRGNNVSEIYSSVQQTLAGQIPELSGLADSAPREIRSSLRQAIDTARRARDMASNWLERQAAIDSGGIPLGARPVPPGGAIPDRSSPGGGAGGRSR